MDVCVRASQCVKYLFCQYFYRHEYNSSFHVEFPSIEIMRKKLMNIFKYSLF